MIDIENNKKARVIAFYLPQFHPILENDEWWGKGFTEWTNVGKAKPLFKGHYQPKVPADLGYYDLRMPEVREAQAEMARNAGIEGFLYWHYWFGNGKTLLERPFQEVLKSGEPDFPFCLSWANHSWSNKTWLPKDQYKPTELLIEQFYPGEEDYRNHFFYILDAFKDKRYIQIEGKPVFFIYAPLDFKEVREFINLWQELAKGNGLNGIFFIGQTLRNQEWETILKLGFDAICRSGLRDAMDKIKGKRFYSGIGFLRNHFKITPLNRCKYSKFIKQLIDPKIDSLENIYPTVISNYDHSPRSGRKALIIEGSTPDLFKEHLQETLDIVQHKEDEHKIIVLRSWNEWAEGNYVEPDLKFGHGYLDVLKESLIPEKNIFPKISIITPSYNQGQYIEETILSVINQNYPNIEYIIIDGGSTDNTIEIIKKYEKHITYWVSEKDSGQSEAINKGFEKANGDIVGWLNSDDILMDKALKKVVNYFEENKNIDIVNGYTLRIDKNSNILYNHFILKQKDFYAKTGMYYMAQPSLFWKRTVLNKIGFLKEDFHARMDKEFLIRMFKNNFEIGKLEKILAAIRIHDAAKTSINREIWSSDAIKLYSLYGNDYGKKPHVIIKIIYGCEKLFKCLYFRQWYFTLKWKGKNVSDLNASNSSYLR